MNRVIAGIHDPDCDRMDERRRTLTRALAHGNAEHFEDDRALAVAFDGAGRSSIGRPRCLLDGHVYNLVDVARTLGVPAEDPEAVLARGFATLGDSLLATLRGDFALVSWNEDGSGLLACDQLGGRGLVFCRHGRRLLFASEMRDLLAMLAARPEPDHASVAHWIGLSGPPADHTMFAGVWRIRPGHLMRFGAESEGQRAYWRPRYRETIPLSRADAAAELRASISGAIARRAGPQERTAVMLSGGLDSSSVAALAKRSLSEDAAPEAAYSAVFPRHRSVDESELIERLADEVGLPSVRIAVEEGSVLAGAVEYMRTWMLPPASPNLFFWLPLLRRAVADGVTAMLDGEGGDEVFAYSEYLVADRLRRGRLVSALSLARQFPSGTCDAGKVVSRLKDYGLRQVVRAPASLRRIRAGRRDPRTTSPPWFTAETAQAYADTDEQWSWLDNPAPLWAAWRAHTLTSSAPVVASDHIRRRSKLVGLEARHPLTDVDVIELMMKLPPELSFDAALSRPLLREAVAGIVPDEIRLRPAKSYFDEVFEGALAGPDLPVARRLLAGPDSELGRYVDVGRLNRDLLAASPPRTGGGRTAWAVQLWRLVTAECWLRWQADNSFPEALLNGGQLRAARYKVLEPF